MIKFSATFFSSNLQSTGMVYATQRPSGKGQVFNLINMANIEIRN